MEMGGGATYILAEEVGEPVLKYGWHSLLQFRGVWGHAPPGKFGFLHFLRSILVHFECTLIM